MILWTYIAVKNKFCVIMKRPDIEKRKVKNLADYVYLDDNRYDYSCSQAETV